MTSAHESLKKRVEVVLDMALTTITSLAETFTSSGPVSNEDAGKGADEATDAVPHAPRESDNQPNSSNLDPAVDTTPNMVTDSTAPPKSVKNDEKRHDGAGEQAEDDSDESDDGEDILQVHN